MYKRRIPFFPLAFLVKMAIQNGGVSLGRIHVFILYLFRYSILEPFRLLEVFIYDRKISRHELAQPPVFILGHWRSGTSHLQNLLYQDPGNTSTTIYTGLFSDNYYLTRPWLKKVLNALCKLFKAQYSIQRTDMDLDIPAELDTGLCSACSAYSYTWGHLFPKYFEKWMKERVLLEDEAAAAGWITEYDFHIRKLSYWSKNKRLIVKSPGDTARLKHLIKKYPGALFIYIHREPFEVFHSNQYLWSVIQKQNSLQKITQERINSLIISTYELLLRNYLHQRDLLPASQRIEVRFSDLRDEPMREVRKIYLALGLGKLPEAEMAAFIGANKNYKASSYTTPPELEKEISVKWDFAFKEWSYKKPGA